MKEKFVIAVCFIFHLFPSGILAQNADIKFIQVEGNNGKPLGQINAITQDPSGYMWFSGQGARSLYRYDGVRMTAFTHDSLNPNSLGPQPFLETVYADNKGLIWIGFINQPGGLDQYNPATGIFKHFINDPNDPASLSAGMVSVILRDHLGRVWVGTQNGLDLLDENTGKFTHYRNEPGNPSSLSYNWVRSLYEDRQGVLWVGTGMEFYSFNDEIMSGGLNRMQPDGSFIRYLNDPKNPHSLINNKVRAIFEDSKGNFWIGTAGDGLHIMDREKGTFTRYPYNPLHPEQLSRPAIKKGGGGGDPLTFIREDAEGAIWIGTYASGMNRYDPATKRITHFESSNGYPDRSCFQSYVSRDGVLWLTSTDQSNFLYRVVPPARKLDETIYGTPAYLIYEDKKGTVWTDDFVNRLRTYRQHTYLDCHLKADPVDSINVTNPSISSIFQTQQDTLWLCTKYGVLLFNIKNSHVSWFKYKATPDAITEKFNFSDVHQIIQDKEGFKWITSYQGLFQISQDNVLIKKFNPIAGDTTSINSNLLSALLEDNTGDIWVGNQKDFNHSVRVGGINRLNRKTGTFKRFLDGISINSFYLDSKGIVWAVTEKGLYRYVKESDRFAFFSGPHEELDGVRVVNIIEDDLKNLWVITESFMMKFNPATNESYISGKKYGIRAGTLRNGGICKTSAGNILVGNNNGFYTFRPEEMNEVSKPLQLNITGFFINNLPVNPGQESRLAQPIEQTDHVALQYNQNNFSFTFAAIDYRAPESNKYFSRLDNYDSIWRDAGGDKSAAYINVPPGKYVFRVKAVNVEGVTAEKSIQVVISPPWWKTTWAYVLYGLLLIGAVIGIDRMQKQKTIQKERQRAQARELAQAREIEKAYTELKATQVQLVQSEKMASLGELTAGIAHEIQNPLNFVNNFSDVNKELLVEMKDELDQGNISEAKEIADDVISNEEKISHHGKKADAIVKSMLQHSRTSSNQKEPYDINALADEYLRLSYHGLRAKDKAFNATMNTDFDGSIGKIEIIPQDIGRVLLNLYNNAFYAVRDKQKENIQGYEPTVLVSTRKNNGKVEIRIKDNGNGIPSKILDKIFQPFFTTKPTGQGTGLGLSLSYDVIKGHNGEIKVDTREKEFSEFLILLPFAGPTVNA